MNFSRRGIWVLLTYVLKLDMQLWKESNMICIYYFSGTGNTRYVAEKLGQELDRRGVICRVKSIEETTPDEASEEIRGCRAVLFGYPIYGSYTCELIAAFLKEVRVPDHVKVGFFCTQMMFSGVYDFTS